MISVQGVDLDVESRRVWRDGVEIRFSNKEFELLHALIRRPGQIVTRDELMREVWHDRATGAEVSLRTVDTHVRRLRAKLGAQARVITTIRGRGYRFEAAADVRYRVAVSGPIGWQTG